MTADNSTGIDDTLVGGAYQTEVTLVLMLSVMIVQAARRSTLQEESA